MTISAALAIGLMATRFQTDIEFKLQTISSRKIALLDRSRKVSEEYYQSMFTPNPFDDFIAQQKLNTIHGIEKELDNRMKQLETKLKIYTQMKESWLKASKENAKKSFTIG